MRFGLFILLFLSFEFVRGESISQLVFLEKIEVSPRNVIRLYDLVEAENVDLEHLKSILVFEQKDSSRKHEKVVFSRNEILDKVRASLEQLGLTLTIKIPEKVEVSFSPHNLSLQEIERKISNRLKIKCLDCRFQIRVSKLPNYSNANWELDFKSLQEKGAFLLPLDQQGFWISGMIRTQKPVVTVKKQVRRNEKINLEDLRQEHQDITFINDYLTEVDQAKEMRVKKDFQPGSLLQTQFLAREPAALRGQMVRVVSGDSTFEVSTQGIAEAQGHVGDVIPLRLMDSKKLISGELVEKGLVKVQ